MSGYSWPLWNHILNKRHKLSMKSIYNYDSNKISREKEIFQKFINNEKCLFLSKLKESIIFDDFNEILRRYYKRKESEIRILKISEIFEKNRRLFPNYLKLSYSKVFSNYIYQLQNILNSTSIKLEKPLKTINSERIFKNNVFKSSVEDSDIIVDLNYIKKEPFNDSIDEIESYVKDLENSIKFIAEMKEETKKRAKFESLLKYRKNAFIHQIPDYKHGTIPFIESSIPLLENKVPRIRPMSEFIEKKETLLTLQKQKSALNKSKESRVIKTGVAPIKRSSSSNGLKLFDVNKNKSMLKSKMTIDNTKPFRSKIENFHKVKKSKSTANFINNNNYKQLFDNKSTIDSFRITIKNRVGNLISQNDKFKNISSNNKLKKVFSMKLFPEENYKPKSILSKNENSIKNINLFLVGSKLKLNSKILKKNH